MAFTQLDLQSVETALLKLTNGERVAAVAYEGKTINYSQVQVKDLTDLRDKMRAELQNAGILPSGKKRHHRVQILTGKGF